MRRKLGLVHAVDQLARGRCRSLLCASSVHHLLRVRDHRVGERREPAVLEVQDAVGDVEDAVVVGDEQDRRAALARERLHAIDDFAARRLVERGRRLVGEHHGRLADERARDRDALALAAGELLGTLVRVLAEAHGLEHRVGPALQLGARGAPGDAQAELHVLRRGQRAEQVVLLEDEADAPAHVLERACACAPSSSWPSTRRLPSCGARSAPTSVSSVVLPEPDGP